MTVFGDDETVHRLCFKWMASDLNGPNVNELLSRNIFFSLLIFYFQFYLNDVQIKIVYFQKLIALNIQP